MQVSRVYVKIGLGQAWKLLPYIDNKVAVYWFAQIYLQFMMVLDKLKFRFMVSASENVTEHIF